MPEDTPRVPYNFEERFEIKFLNDAAVRYQKIDHVRACRFGTNFAVTFYQLDYQQAVDLVPPGTLPGNAPRTMEVMPVARMVMDEEGFKMLLDQVQTIARLTNIGDVSNGNV